MQTVIVPIDFSETSLNAAKYAKKLLGPQTEATIILYHIYEKANLQNEAVDKLTQLKQELFTDSSAKLITVAEEGHDFINELEKLARHQQADLIIMGITGRTALGQTLIGSNTLKMVDRKVCPVLIVPPDASFEKVENVLLTSDFKDVYRSTPSSPIKKILKALKPNFFVLNVDSNHYVAITEEYQKEKETLAEMFSEFNPQFFFMGFYDVDESINQFAADKNIDLIIIVHKDQSLVSKLFVKSHTKKLVYHSSVPILAVHE